MCGATEAVGFADARVFAVAPRGDAVEGLCGAVSAAIGALALADGALVVALGAAAWSGSGAISIEGGGAGAGSPVIAGASARLFSHATADAIAMTAIAKVA